MKSQGFTLVELLIVVVIIGILAAFAIPQYINTKEKAYVAQMKTDLKNLATAEEAFFYDSTRYASLAQLVTFRPSTGVTVSVVEATAQGWSASAVHRQTVRQCALFNGVLTGTPPSPATVEGRITCS